VAWALAVGVYFAVGFAFQFGGIAVVYDEPDLTGLYWEYSLLDVSWGTGWGMIGLRGFLMLGEASTPGALGLFLSHLPFLGVATLIPFFAAWGRTRRWVALLASLMMGSLIYPLVGNWISGGGWVANLGGNLSLGHGFIDAGGGGLAVLTGAAAALAALLVLRIRSSRAASQTKNTSPSAATTEVLPPTLSDALGEPAPGEPLVVPMPPVHLPLLGWLGAALMTIGWMATSSMAHLPTATDVSPAVIATGVVLAAFGGTLTASLYGWFTTGSPDVLMSARGLAAGLVLAAAGAPFLPAWVMLAAGLLIGIILPPLIYLFDRRLGINDSLGMLAAFGIPVLVGLLLPGLLASGRYGVGWNGVGLDSFLGVEGQGVSGLWVMPGLTGDWPGQMAAQLIGIIAITAWSFGLSWLLVTSSAGLIHAWERSGLEFGSPPEPVGIESGSPQPVQDESLADPMLQPQLDSEAPLVSDHED
ncbi:MAG: ammonium transporter, partial [Ardenticatenia bacterium]|nr:ammonium transporter [Ardenticatenia bacterium]